MIPTEPIGNTGLALSRIGFGTAPLGDLRRAPTEEEARDVLQGAWDAVIRYFDTAPMYGSGLAERRLGDFLRDKPRDTYVLSTKVGRRLVPDRNWALERYGDPRALPFRFEFDLSYEGVMRSFEQSLQRLGLERIDILYLHDVGRFSQGDRHEQSWPEALNGAIPALLALREAGVVSAIGAGVNEWQVLNQLMDHARWDVFLLANRYTLLDNEAATTLFPRCAREGVRIVAGAPLHNGLLATGAVPGAQYDYRPAPQAVLDRVTQIEAACARFGVPLLTAALTFPLGHPVVASVLPGPATPEHLASNLEAFLTAVPPQLWAVLKQEGLLSYDVPVPTTPVL